VDQNPIAQYSAAPSATPKTDQEDKVQMPGHADSQERPSAALVLELLAYDPESGILTWRWRDRRHFRTDASWKRWNTTYTGRPAGTLSTNGYLRVRIGRRTNYPAHHLAWAIMTGSWPTHRLDHRDHTRTNNRWANLREATALDNNRNAARRVDNASGATGVVFDKRRQRWRARIKFEGELQHLGSYDTKEKAIQARRLAEAAYGFDPSHGLEIGQEPTTSRHHFEAER